MIVIDGSGDKGDHVQVAADDQGQGRQSYGGDRGDPLQGQQVQIIISFSWHFCPDHGSTDPVFILARIRILGFSL